MSLLMDALRKAEQQKQKLAQQSAAGSEPSLEGELTLEPISRQLPAEVSGSPSSPQEHLPDLPSSLEALDEQFMAHAASARPEPRPAIPSKPAPVAEKRAPIPPSEPPSPKSSSSAPPPSQPPPVSAAAVSSAETDEASRATARKLFEAKLPTANRQSTGARNKNFAIAIGLITLVAAIGIGGYFWWQLQPTSGLTAAIAPPPLPPTQPSPQATPASPPAAIPAVSPSPLATAPQSPPVAVPPAPTFAGMPTASAPATASHANDNEAEDVEEAAPPPRRQRTTATPPTVPAMVSQPTTEPASTFQRTVTPPRINPLLAQAHEAYGRGEIELARAVWQQALTADPRNPDALRGLAVLAQAGQQTGEAAAYFNRALEVDPKDAIALAGLLALQPPSDTLQLESRLKTLLAEQPEAAALHFALGNQFARQQRWAEAQQAYFKAYTVEPTNPAYLFNLAVSLDQLHQSRLAVRYYREALEAAERQPGAAAGFERTGVQIRLKQLQAADVP